VEKGKDLNNSFFIKATKNSNDLKGIRKSIGVVFQDSILDNLLTVKENLYTRGSFYGLTSRELATAVEKASRAADVVG